MASIAIELPVDTLRPSGAAQARVIARDAAGNTVKVDTTIWSASPAQVVRINPFGVVTAIAPGTALVTAQVGSRSATRTLYVVSAPVDQLVLAPAGLFIAPGESRRVSAAPLDAAGRPLPDRPVVWLSTDTTKVTVTADGVITAVAPGRAVVAAVSEKVYAVVDVRISGPPGVVTSVSVSPKAAGLSLGDTVRLRATLEDSIGNVATNRPIVWASSAPGVAPVTSDGLVRGLTKGAALITARSELGVDTVRITVTDPADFIEVFIGRPLPGDLVGDSLPVIAHMQGKNQIVSVRATVVNITADLFFVLTNKEGWRGTVDISPLHYGAYELIVTATDEFGNTGVSTVVFSKGAVVGLGGLGNPSRSK